MYMYTKEIITCMINSIKYIIRNLTADLLTEVCHDVQLD